jgi:hypothetical protein
MRLAMTRMTREQWQARLNKIREYVKRHGPTNYKALAVFLGCSPTTASIWCGTCISVFRDMKYEDGVLSIVREGGKP